MDQIFWIFNQIDVRVKQSAETKKIYRFGVIKDEIK